MAELKTKMNDTSVTDFLDKIDDPQKSEDAYTILTMMKKISGQSPKMWGSSIIGFGRYHYKYKSGQESDWMKTGFSPRRQNLIIYACVMSTNMISFWQSWVNIRPARVVCI